MRISPFDEEQFRSIRKKNFISNGFSVQMILPLAIRYHEKGRSITVFTEFQSRNRRWTAFLPWIIRELASKNSMEVIIELPLVWDNSTESPLTPENLIIERIEKILKKCHFEYTIRRFPIRLEK